MLSRYSAFVVGALLAGVGSAALAAPGDVPDDRFIAGYASAVLERDYNLAPSVITVDHGVIRLASKDVGAVDRDRIVTALKRVRGVQSVEFVEAPPPPPVAVTPNEPVPAPAGQGVATKVELRRWTFLSTTDVFEPLVADPRWPHFSAAYDRYTSGHAALEDVASVSFGESLSLYQSPTRPSGQLEIGIQAAVFAIFDLNAESKDLVNADYFVGPIAEYRNGDLSGFLRVYHQSSHVGDEFILDHPGFQRVNLSYEKVDGILSYDFFGRTLRLYGGAGYLFDVDPSNLHHLAVQYGVEYRGPRIFPSVGMTPIVAVDFQQKEYNNWSLDLSARAGVQFEDPAILGRRVQLLLEYYNGHSPNGQFFTEQIQFIGLGLHFYL